MKICHNFYCLYCILHIDGVLDIVCQYIFSFYKEGIICFIIIAITTFLFTTIGA
jgi:hypothetical protein